MSETKKNNMLNDPQNKQNPHLKVNKKTKISKPETINPLQDLKYTFLQYSNIIEVSEQYETNRFENEAEQIVDLIKQPKKGFWQKTVSCLKYFLPCFEKENKFSINVKKSQLLETIEKLKNEDFQLSHLLAPLSSNLKTLVLDLDQVLVFSSPSEVQKFDFSFEMNHNNKKLKVYSKIRFGLESFLFEMSKIYEIVIYTSNITQYAQQIIKNIDKQKRISHVLFKNKCFQINKTFHLKSLKLLGRQPHNVIFLDHNLATGLLQPQNLLSIKPFTGQSQDRQLIKMIPFLRQLSRNPNPIPVMEKYESYWNREIHLKYNSMDKSRNDSDKQNEFDTQNPNQIYNKYIQIMESKRRKYKHKKVNSEIECLNNEEGSTQNSTENSEVTNTALCLKNKWNHEEVM